MKTMKFVFIVFFILTLSSCGLNTEINSISKNKLKYEKIENCIITSICDLSSLNYKPEKVEMSKEEFEDCVSDEIEEFYRYKEITNRDYVKKGDYITISYISKCENKVIDKNDSKKLKVGAGNFDKQAEEKIIGAKKNKKFEITITVPKSEQLESIAGKKEVMEITVLNITKLVKPKITNEWVKKHFNYNSVDEFYRSIKENYIEQEQAFADLNAKENLLSDAIKASSFELDNDSVLVYAKKLYHDEENNAISYGTSLEEYVNSFYNIDLDTFYQQCYDNAKGYIKRILLIGAIAENINITVSKKELTNYFKAHNLTLENISKEEKELNKYEVLENKVIEYMIKAAK